VLLVPSFSKHYSPVTWGTTSQKNGNLETRGVVTGMYMGSVFMFCIFDVFQYLLETIKCFFFLFLFFVCLLNSNKYEFGHLLDLGFLLNECVQFS
jgi:multisubunit Na+/H+ antiporter MnhE subunit